MFVPFTLLHRHVILESHLQVHLTQLQNIYSASFCFSAQRNAMQRNINLYSPIPHLNLLAQNRVAGQHVHGP